ncbi:hypothetical protein KDH_12520 [Dictyobacter sp. S3.2.2.5]|uniref:AAA+ ATPase domain-containing protein n=1 Tax=Dictyobacter halimunensis TaxID=3026934 RepID=A0ABQ6FPF7_9CHLR|nr:hypothetical protein KDH_12520 [Dictyobacter sp. S3.2.2.5]
MMRQEIAPLVNAREVLWIYSGLTEEPDESAFYQSLRDQVAAQIARQVGKQRVRVGREVHIQLGEYQLRAHLTNIEPVLANYIDTDTEVIIQYRHSMKSEGQDISTFIAEVIRHPDQQLLAQYDMLVGIDDIKHSTVRKLQLLLEPDRFMLWQQEQYGAERFSDTIGKTLMMRYPLLIFAGEVGSGKTMLARSVGSVLAQLLQVKLVSFLLNTQVRGDGHVGEITRNIARAFDEIERCQEREQVPVILFIDEADSLAQARGKKQTHHEDDAGVNTLIQRIDRLRGKPIAVLMATNFSHGLDPAILRRALVVHQFMRPSAVQRGMLFRRILGPLGSIKQAWMEELIVLTEPRSLPDYGEEKHRYTYSDLAQRIIPQALETAVLEQTRLKFMHFRRACEETFPTPESRKMELSSTEG